MLKKKILLISVISSLVFIACDKDFLETVPYTDRVEENFYQTPEHAFEGLVAVYDKLQTVGYGHFILTSEIISDNCFGGFGKSDNIEALEWDNFTMNTNKNLNGAIWQGNYQGIYRANTLLQNIDKIDWTGNEDLKSQYIAECRFLRAHFHFELARLFGNIPMVDKVLSIEEASSVPQASPEALYAFIAEDFKYAADNMDDTSYANMPVSDYGRVTKWAAESYLAKVFLFYTDYYNQSEITGVLTKAQAISYINDVVDNSSHNLLDDYSHLWLAASLDNYAGENNEEIVWSVKYNSSGQGDFNLNEGNRWQVMIALRTQVSPPYANGWGAASVNPAYYNAFEDGDTRRDATIIAFEEQGVEFDNSDQRQYTGYAWKKYMPITNEEGVHTVVVDGGDFQIDNYEDYVVIRFADVLLMAAELNLDTNNGLSQTYFNRVRNRAFEGAAPSVSVSKEAILNERRFEFGLEGHRYWDLIRHDLNEAKQILDNTTSGFEVNFRTETGGFLGIPEQQINLSNGTLNQNTGW